MIFSTYTPKLFGLLHISEKRPLPVQPDLQFTYYRGGMLDKIIPKGPKKGPSTCLNYAWNVAVIYHLGCICEGISPENYPKLCVIAIEARVRVKLYFKPLPYPQE
jgi:hypothetical protein